MALTVVIGGKTFAAIEASIERAIGQPVRWRCRGLRVSPDIDGTRDLETLASVLAKPATSIDASHDGTPLLKQGRVVSARWRDGGSRLLEIEAHTSAPANDADVFKPRRRVHRVSTWRQLVDRFSQVAMCSTGVRNHLESHTFPSEKRTSLIQDGESDWAFLGRMFAHFAQVEKNPALSHLALIGGNTSSTTRKWLIDWAAGAGYEHFHDVEPRLVAGPEDVAHTLFLFDGVDQASFAATSPTARVPAVGRQWRDRPFGHSAWQSWVARDVPLFVGANRVFVWRVIDTVKDAGQPRNVSWTTELWSVPSATALPTVLPLQPVTPWEGTGTVTRSTAREHWMEVKVDGFEPGEDLVEARVTTPYGGKDNAKGLHFVPEKGTPVSLAWSGRFNDPMLVLANVRSKSAAFDSPSVWLESKFTTQYTDIACKSVGAVSVDSNLQMSVKGKTDVSSKQPMALKADGCDVELQGGIFHTGSGM